MSLSRLLCTSCLIREALPPDLAKSLNRALRIVHAERGAIAKAEVKFMQIALQMRFANMVIRPEHAALKDSKIRLDRVAVNTTGARVFANRMIGGLMRRKLFTQAHALVVASVVRVQRRLLRNVLHQDRAKVVRINVGDMETARRAFAIHKRDNLAKVDAASALYFRAIAEAANAPTLGFADVSLIHLDRTAIAAHRHDGSFAERFADAMRHEPRSLVRDAEGAVELVRAHALFGRAEKQHGLQPDIQLDLAALENGANRDSELLAAIPALVEAGTMRFALKLVVVANDAAMRAHRAVRPLDALKVFARLVRVLEVRKVQMTGFAHG